MEKQKTAVLQMFYGQRVDSDKIKCPPEYNEYIDKAIEYNNKLLEKIKDMPEAFELFNQFNDWTDRAYALEVDAYYAEGFKFGLLIGVEAGESKYE